MGEVLRVFFIDESDLFVKVPCSRWNRLWARNPKECFPQYSGKVLRTITVYLQVEKRKATEINKIDAFYTTFDSKGRLDKRELQKEIRTAMGMLPYSETCGKQMNVIRTNKFAIKSYHEKYKWDPSPEILNRVIKEIFRH